MAAGEESASGSATSKITQFVVVGSIWKKLKVLIMERPSVELAVIIVVRSLLTMGPLLP